MQQKLKGLMIRRRRLERKMPQSELCRGICAVSYLSKIELGKVDCSPEVLRMLFERLNIRWNEDANFCRTQQNWVDECYDRLFSGEELDDLPQALAQREAEYRDSPFFLDWALLSNYVSDGTQTDVEDLLPAMDSRQLSLYLCTQGRYEELLQMPIRSFFLLEAGKHSYWQGEYSVAMTYLQQSMQRASEEGSFPVMMYCALFLGNCYNSLNQIGQACAYYRIGNRMARSLGSKRLMRVTLYNIATMELQQGQPEKALQYFLRDSWNEAMYYQKLAHCYERLGMNEQALQTLDLALKAPIMELSCSPEQAKDILERLCMLTRYRIEHADYLHREEYGSALTQLLEMMERLLSPSFARFYVPWLEEWCTANRKYRTAYELLRKYRM